MTRATVNIEGCLQSINSEYADQRGAFRKIASQPSLEDILASRRILQVNLSKTDQAGTIRGMHVQVAPSLESKIVTCLSGRIFDVVLDCRPNSGTFMQWQSWILDADECSSLVIPEGCAHGFQSLTDNVSLLYLHTATHDSLNDRVINPFSRFVEIDWPLECSRISDRDKSAPEEVPQIPSETL